VLPRLETRVNEFSTKRHACYRAGSAEEARLWARAAAVSGPGRSPRSRSKRPTQGHNEGAAPPVHCLTFRR
jgi:hypothetical protein